MIYEGKNKLNRAKVLFITPRLPYPPIGGDKLKNFWLLKILSQYFRVHLVSLTETKPPAEFYEWADSLCITYKIFQKPRSYFFLRGLKSLVESTPFQVNYYYFRDVQKYINSIYQEFDLIYVNLVRMTKYALKVDKPKILDLADSIGLNYQHAKIYTKSLKWKIIYSIEAKRLLDFEKLCIITFDRTLFFNLDEMKYFNVPEKTRWLPHGVNEELLTYERYNPTFKNYVCFFGKMNYQPNIDAVLWFVKNVLPKLKKEIKFAIIGAYPTDKIKALSKKYENVLVTGYMDDPYEILKSSLCIVAPIFTGGGIQNKVLESMALGTINIVSSKTAKPIGATPGAHYLVEDQPDKIAEIINDIFLHPSKYQHLKFNSRKFIQNNFTWSIYEKKLLEIIEEVLK